MMTQGIKYPYNMRNKLKGLMNQRSQPQEKKSVKALGIEFKEEADRERRLKAQQEVQIAEVLVKGVGREGEKPLKNLSQ